MDKAASTLKGIAKFKRTLVARFIFDQPDPENALLRQRPRIT